MAGNTPKNLTTRWKKSSFAQSRQEKTNISDRAKDEYGKAFLREFKKFLGKEVAGRSAEGLEIKVLGQGCASATSWNRRL